MGGAEKYAINRIQISYPIAVLLIALSVVALRLPTFWITSIDIDAGVFALVSRELMNGHLPYETVFEHKPIALYYPAAFFMTILGSSPEVMNFTSAVLVWVTCLALFLYAVGQGVSRAHSVGLAVCYAIMTCGYQGYAS
ncbi:MAG: hypothetical protein AAFQ75_12150, partial [Pseudomonadota bacterium]